MADQQLKDQIHEILRAHFPVDTVDVSDGYADNIHVIVVSKQFDGMREKAKQDLLWSFIDGSTLTDAQKTKISMILPVSPQELK